MEFKSIYRNSTEIIFQLDQVLLDLRKMNCSTHIETRKKAMIIENLNNALTLLFIGVEIMDEVLESKENETSAEIG